MVNSKLISILRSLSTKQLSKLNDFLSSPYHNKSEDLKKIGLYLIKEAPLFKREGKIKKERVFRHIYSNKKFVANKLYNLSSRLLALVYEFLALEEWEAEEKYQRIYTLKQLGRLYNEEHSQAIQQYYTKMPILDDLTTQYLLDYKYHKELDKQFIDKSLRRYDENLQETSNNLDLFFLSEKLKIACDMQSRNIVIKADYQCYLIETIIEPLEKDEKWRNQAPILEIYIVVWKMLINKTPDYYQELKRLGQKYTKKLPKRELMSVYRYGLNFCIQQINKGSSIYFEEIFTLYKYLIEEGILTHDGSIPAWDFKNIVTTSIRIGAYDWGVEFLENYQQKLPEDIRENAFLYNSAALSYAQKDYRTALQTLYNVEFTDISYALGAKILQIKSYYELYESNALMALIESFTNYIRRNKQISAYQQKATQHFLRITRQVQKLREMKDWAARSQIRQRWEQINKRIDQLVPIANKDWLLECLEKLK